MLTKQYNILECDTDRVVDTVTKLFQNADEQREWESKQIGHPFLYVREVAQ